MPNIRSIFNFEHPWLDFNLILSAALLGRACEVGTALGCMYQLAPWISNSFTGPSITDRHNKLITVGLRISYVAMLGWRILRSGFAIAPNLDDKTMDPPGTSSDVASARPWLNRYVDGASIAITYLCSFSAPTLVQTPLGFCHHLLPYIFSTAILGFCTLDFFRPFISWRRVSMAMTLPIYRTFIDPERQRIAQEKISLSRGFLEKGPAKPSFEYLPLTSPRMIRLLRVKVEESNEAKAICDLIEVEIDDPPPYEAVSYRWGPTPIDQKFHMCIASSPGKHIPLTENAYDALQALTPTDGIRYLWVDSICINQADTSEKTLQVALMGKIYSSAQRVVVFLGPQSEHSRATSFLSRISYFYVEAGYLEGNESAQATIRSLHTVLDRDFAPGVEDIAAFQDLLNNDYFCRAWIIQECVLARNINILFGNITFPWMVLTLSFLFLRKEDAVLSSMFFSKHGGLLQTKRNTEVLAGLIELRAHYHSQEPAKSLVELVVSNVFSQATDPKDKVYSLLGLCSEADVKAIKPSYEKNTKTVYIDFVRHALEQRSYLSFSISGLAYDDVVLGSLNLPSWLPRFSQKSELLGTSRYHERRYQAGSNLLCGFNIAPPGDILRLRGNPVDVISNKSSDFDFFDAIRRSIKGPIIDVATDHASKVMEMQDLFELHAPEGQSQSEERKEAFWRTILDDSGLQDFSGQAEIPMDTAQLEEFLAKLRSGNIWGDVPAGDTTRLSLRQLYEQGITLQAPIIDAFLKVMLLGRTFAVTQEKKLYASVPIGTEVGDIVVIFNGAPAPCILRPTGDDDACYYLVGEAYVHGNMHGEAMKSENSQWFDLR